MLLLSAVCSSFCFPCFFAFLARRLPNLLPSDLSPRRDALPYLLSIVIASLAYQDGPPRSPLPPPSNCCRLCPYLPRKSPASHFAFPPEGGTMVSSSCLINSGCPASPNFKLAAIQFYPSVQAPSKAITKLLYAWSFHYAVQSPLSK